MRNKKLSRKTVRESVRFSYDCAIFRTYSSLVTHDILSYENMSDSRELSPARPDMGGTAGIISGERLCCRIVLKITLTAGGASVASLERRSRTKAQANQPWIHADLSLLSAVARLLRRLTTAAGPCGTRADFAATDVAARALVKIHVSRNAINTLLQQSEQHLFFDRKRQVGL